MRLNGTVLQEGRPVEGAYVRLIGPSGDFTAELRTDDSGQFIFYPVAGDWTLVGFLPGGVQVKCTLSLTADQSADVNLKVPSY